MSKEKIGLELTYGSPYQKELFNGFLKALLEALEIQMKESHKKNEIIIYRVKKN